MLWEGIFLLKNFLTSCWILGMQVDLLTRIFLLILDFFGLEFFRTFWTGFIVEQNSSLNLARVSVFENFFSFKEGHCSSGSSATPWLSFPWDRDPKLSFPCPPSLPSLPSWVTSPRPAKKGGSVSCSLSVVDEGHKVCDAFYHLREWLL